MKNLLLLLLPIASLSNEAAAQLEKIYLNPKAAVGGNQSMFVDSIRFIPLENVEGSDASKYNNIIITPKLYIINDYPNKNLVFYSEEGRFLKKVNWKRLGEGLWPDYKEKTNQIVFYGRNKNFSLTPADLIKIELDRNNPRNRKYFKKYLIDLEDATFTIQRSEPDEYDLKGVYPFHGNRYYAGKITTSKLYKDSIGHEITLYENYRPVKSWFPYNRVNEPRFLYTSVSSGISGFPDAAVKYLSRPFCDTIYKISADTLYPAFQIVFPLENTLPASFFTQPFKNRTDRDNFNRNNGWLLHQVYGFNETPHFISFVVAYLSNFEGYIYAKESGVIYKTQKIKADSTQYNLNLLDDWGGGAKKSRSYKLIKASDIIPFFKNNKTITIPEVLKPLMIDKYNPHTPILVEYRRKD